MQQENQTHHASLDAIRADFMDIYSEIYRQELANKKKSKVKQRFKARRAIEEYHEMQSLKQILKNGWDEA